MKVRVEGRRRVEGVVRMMNLLLRVKRRQTHTHRRGKYINATPASLQQSKENVLCNHQKERLLYLFVRSSNCKRTSTQTILLVGRHLQRECKTLGGRTKSPKQQKKMAQNSAKDEKTEKGQKTGRAVKPRLD